MCIHNKAVGCPGACRSHPPINYYGCGLVLAPPRLHPAFAPRETMTFVGLDDECLESFCKAEGRANELDRCSAALCTCRDACRQVCRVRGAGWWLVRARDTTPNNSTTALRDERRLLY